MAPRDCRFLSLVVVERVLNIDGAAWWGLGRGRKHSPQRGKSCYRNRALKHDYYSTISPFTDSFFFFSNMIFWRLTLSSPGGVARWNLEPQYSATPHANLMQRCHADSAHRSARVLPSPRIWQTKFRAACGVNLQCKQRWSETIRTHLWAGRRCLGLPGVFWRRGNGPPHPHAFSLTKETVRCTQSLVSRLLPTIGRRGKTSTPTLWALARR